MVISSLQHHGGETGFNEGVEDTRGALPLGLITKTGEVVSYEQMSYRSKSI